MGLSAAYAGDSPTKGSVVNTSIAEAYALWQAGTFVVDVRTPEEFFSGHLPGARNIDVAALPDRLHELQHIKDRPILVYCRSGRRSLKAAEILVNHGFSNVRNMEGGILAWNAAHSDVLEMPFSFTLGGKPSGTLLPTWKCESTSQPMDTDRTQHVVSFSEPASGLVARFEYIQYTDFPASEWTVYFKNTGSTDSALLEDIQPLSQTLAGGEGAYRLCYSRGSHEAPSDFEPQASNLETPVHLAPYGGRSSDGVLPFFSLMTPRNDGVILGIGWTGQWAASFEKSAQGVRMRAGMERTHLILHPGEEIRTPAILLLHYAGAPASPYSVPGSNALRRLLLKHYTPRPKGQEAIPPIAASPHGTIAFTKTTEEAMIQGIKNIAAHSPLVDTWWIDAGWHGEDDNWARNPGTWTPNRTRFPKGLKPVGEAAHANGMRFLLWTEPERVMRGMELYENHRDWLLAPADLPKELQYQANDGFYLLNLGNPEALDWAKKTFSGLITEYGIDIYRQDFNMTPIYFWRNQEPEDRQGMNEIRYITGLYDFYDALLRDHPGLLIDNCASGGRRIDFEIMRRALTLFRSDCCWDPIGEQCMNYGISPWMPITGVGAVTLDPYAFRSGFGSHLSLALDFYSSADLWPALNEALRQYQSVRQWFSKDFYPLTPYSLSKDAWIAWQYQDPDTDKGLVQAFRRPDNPAASIQLPLQCLQPGARYNVTNLDGGGPSTHAGKELMETGLPVTLPNAPGAALITYRKEP